LHVAEPRRLRHDTVFRLEETRSGSNDWFVRYDNGDCNSNAAGRRRAARSWGTKR